MNEESAKVYITEVVVEDVRFYKLKPRDSDNAVIPPQSVNKDHLKDFVLPQEEVHVPVV